MTTQQDVQRNEQLAAQPPPVFLCGKPTETFKLLVTYHKLYILERYRMTDEHK